MTQSSTNEAPNPESQYSTQHESRFPSIDPRKKLPFVAGFLSLLPGLGQVYVGYYQRGFLHVIVASGVLTLLIALDEADSTTLIPMGVVFLIFFELYNIIDAVRRAALYNLTLDGVEQVVLPDDLSRNTMSGSFSGGVGLFVVGAIALSHTAFGLSIEWLAEWWPVAPIILGSYLFYQAYVDRNAASDEGSLPAE
jgi:hypothetical protein